MRYCSKWCFASVLLAVFLIFSSSKSPAALSSDRDDRTREINSATLYKRVGDILVFATDRGGRMRILRGKLSDQTQILDKNEEEIDARALKLGSVWRIKLEYPILEGELLIILEMRRIRPKPPG